MSKQEEFFVVMIRILLWLALLMAFLVVPVGSAAGWLIVKLLVHDDEDEDRTYGTSALEDDVSSSDSE